LVCKEGDGAECLTPAQADSAKRAYSPLKTKSGELVYPGHSPGFESGWRIPTPGTPINPLFADSPRYLAEQNANWDLMSFDLDKDLSLALKNAGFIEANDPDLSKFKARGGKLLLYHGWADPGPAPENTINYYSQVVQKTGKADDWMRLFLLPGVGHCGGGVGPDRADYLTALEQWREKGIAPGEIVASRNRAGKEDMTRPLCPYPQVAKWNGSGSSDDAKNFVCTAK
jgi:feruloyl esterase